MSSTHSIITVSPNSAYTKERCPVSHRYFQAGDEVVICDKTKAAFLLAAYKYLVKDWHGNCPYCKLEINIETTRSGVKAGVEVRTSERIENRSTGLTAIAIGVGVLLIVAFAVCVAGGGIAFLGSFSLLTQAPTPASLTGNAPGGVPPTSEPPSGASPFPASTTPPPFLEPSSTPLPTIRSSTILQGHIIFTCFDGNDDEVCLMNADGTGLTQLTNNSVGDFYASLSHDGSRIVFAHQIKGSNYEIFRMNTDGSVVQLTFNGAGNFAPAYSSDDTLIVFTSTQGGTGQQIWVMAGDGSNPRQLTASGDNVDPAWSPDGQYISFTSDRSGDWQVWIMNADGSSARQVTAVSDVGGRNSWSADGRTIVFYAGKKDDRSRNIYTVDIDGSNLRQLTFEGDNLGPCFSPFGGWIAFTSYRDGNNEIYIMQEDGSNAINLTQSTSSDYQSRWGP